MFRWREWPASRIVVTVVLLLSMFAQFMPDIAQASTLVQAYVRTDRMATSQFTSGLVCAMPNTIVGVAKVAVGFPATFTVSSTLTNWTVGTANIPSGSTAWPGIGTATNVTSTTVTFPSSNLTSNSTLYCFQWTNTTTALQLPASAANSEQATVSTENSSATVLDSTNIALSTYGNDQITVSATVPPSFSFSLASSTSNLGTLSPGSVSVSAGDAVTVTTNAKGGYILWAEDSRQGLFSPGASYTIKVSGASASGGSNYTLAAGTEGYVLDPVVTTPGSGCTLTTATSGGDNYGGGATSSFNGGSFGDEFLPIANCITGTTQAAGDVVTLYEITAISGVTPAGSDYTDLITTVAAGSF